MAGLRQGFAGKFELPLLLCAQLTDELRAVALAGVPLYHRGLIFLDIHPSVVGDFMFGLR